MHKCQGTSQLLLLPGQTLNRTYRLRDSVIGRAGRRAGDAVRGHRHHAAGARAVRRRAAARRSDGRRCRRSRRRSPTRVGRRSAAQRSDGRGAGRSSTGLAAVRELAREARRRSTLSDDARYEIDFRLAQKERSSRRRSCSPRHAPRGARRRRRRDAGAAVKLSLVCGEPRTGRRRGLRASTLAGLRRSIGDAAAGVGQDGVRLHLHGHRCDSRVSRHSPGPYWTPRTDAARYDFEPDVPFGLPFRPSPFRATFALSIAAQT